MEPRRILVIDDDLEVCGLLEIILGNAGYQVETVNASLNTVASLLVNRYDLVTVDLRMPNMDGADVAQLARILDNQVPIVVISGFLTPGVEARFQEMGVHHFLHKPFQAHELLETCEAAIRGATPL